MPPIAARQGAPTSQEDGRARDPSAGETSFGRLWSLAGPVRAYVRRSPIHRGKGWLIRRVLLPLLPPEPAVFLTRLPGGGVLHLHPRETLGYATLIYGGFEGLEISAATALARPGTAAFDVGANVGIYSVALARAVGAQGLVVAIEPHPTSVRRLQANLALNNLGNVQILEGVAAERRGVVELHIADDAAYNSVGQIEGRHVAVGSRTVQSVRLDDVWAEIGQPAVSFVKIDVEGAEVSVVRGALAMLNATRPSLLAEANSEAALSLLRQELEPLGYRESSPTGFQPCNHLFVHREEPVDRDARPATTVRA